MSTVTKVSLPDELQKQMKLFHQDLIDLPIGYVNFHQDLAMKRLKALEAEYGLKVGCASMKTSGWLDPMKELNVTVTDQTGQVHRLSWSDFNQDFMVNFTTGGRACMHPDQLFGGA